MPYKIVKNGNGFLADKTDKQKAKKQKKEKANQPSASVNDKLDYIISLLEGDDE